MVRQSFFTLILDVFLTRSFCLLGSLRFGNISKYSRWKDPENISK